MNKITDRIRSLFVSKLQPKGPKQLATFREWSAAHGQNDSSGPYRAFKELLVSLEGIIQRSHLETMDELWYHNESSEAINTLIENLIDLEPRPTLADKQRTAILRLAKEEDQFQEQRWQKYHDEMGPEKLEQYGIKKPQSLTAAFTKEYP